MLVRKFDLVHSVVSTKTYSLFGFISSICKLLMSTKVVIAT